MVMISKTKNAPSYEGAMYGHGVITILLSGYDAEGACHVDAQFE